MVHFRLDVAWIVFVVRTVGAHPLFRIFPPSLLKVLFDLEGGGESHGVSKGIMAMARVEAVVEEKWMKHGMLLSL